MNFSDERLTSHMDNLAARGLTVIDSLISADEVSAIRTDLAPHLGKHSGRNSFEGFGTERVYTLVARGRRFEAVVEHPGVLEILDRYLLPGYLLTASQAINISPGERAQPLHFDDAFYRLPRPRPAVSYSMILAVDPFTLSNGATEVIPGSHLWDDEQVEEALKASAAGEDVGLQPIELAAGSCIVFSGALLHRGGANRTPAARLAITNQYCEPWARTQENFFLGVPKDIARTMTRRVQQLLGYDIWPPFMGHVTASHPLKTLDPDYRSPLSQG